VISAWLSYSELDASKASYPLAEFYIPSTPPALLERHRIEPATFAGTPEDWMLYLTETYAQAGLNHALVSFTDPFTLRAWAGIDVQGLPDLGEQVRLFGERVLPEISSL
jgi:hypothetical protein